MFELRSDEKKYPILVESYEESCAYVQAIKIIYERDIFVTGEIPEEFDFEKYSLYFNDMNSRTVNLLILGHDLAQLQQKEDFAVLLTPIFEANEKLVQQYKEGNEKALNALLGKFLKDNKGYEPREVKEEIIKLIGV